MEITQRRSALADAVFPGQGLLRDAALVVGFALLVALFAQMAVRLPFTPVPITGQTLAVLLTGGALGANRGAASLALYAVIGGFLPVFAPTSAALDGETFHFILPWIGTSDWAWNLASGGYIVGFVGAAWLVGRLAERGWDRTWRVLAAMLAGNVVLYVPGLLWLRYGYGFDPGIDWATALDWGLWPFVAGDLAKLYAAAFALPAAWALVGRKGRG